uniref:Uncharacterized protein n=1 Tax=Rangifer tarandus platyrhynchus TaxID=3082113 RepID=A0ACB0EQT0_RANTA|nr:unnamed protein product [Rangifer tarandus platyrhynchus]
MGETPPLPQDAHVGGKQPPSHDPRWLRDCGVTCPLEASVPTCEMGDNQPTSQDAPAGVTAPPSCFWDLCLAPLAPGGETLDPCLQDGDNNSTSLQIEVRSRPSGSLHLCVLSFRRPSGDCGGPTADDKNVRK